jgi:nitrogen fixation NifU-like protein
MKCSQIEEGSKSMTEKFDQYVQELQETMLDGYSENLKNEFLNPENLGKIDDPDSHVSVTGICGDTVEIYLSVTDGRISDIKFMTDGCGPTIACVSYVTRTAMKKSIEKALQIKPEDVDKYFGGLPEEHKHCAKLSVMTLGVAIGKYRNGLKNK